MHLQLEFKDVIWKTDIMEFDHAVIADDVFDSYLLLGKYELANEILKKQEKSQEPKSLIKVAESYLEKGNRKKADEIFSGLEKTLDVAEYGDSFDLGNLIEIYLKLDEPEKAEKIVKSLSGSRYMQQKQSLNIADFYIKKKNYLKALEILNFALEQTKKIDVSEEEDGRFSSSNKSEQAKYQSQIALRFIDMQSDKKALEIISQIKKPYLRVLTLTKFVSVNKNRISSKKLSSYLEEALSLLRKDKEEIFDSNKYDVYAIVARNFAEIGMTEKANNVFAEVLSKDKEMVEKGLDKYLLTD